MKKRKKIIDGIVANNKPKIKKQETRIDWKPMAWGVLEYLDAVVIKFGDLSEKLILDINNIYYEKKSFLQGIDWGRYFGYARKTSEFVLDKAKIDIDVEKTVSKIDFDKAYWKYKNFVFALIVIAVSTFLSLGSWVVVSQIFQIQEGVVSAAGGGMDNVRSGVDLMKSEDFAGAAIKFSDAIEDFELIEDEIIKTGHSDLFLQQSLVGEEVDEITAMIDGVLSMTRGAKFLALSLDEIKMIDPDESFSGLFFGMILGVEKNDQFFGQLSRAGEYLSISSSELNNAIEKLEEVNVDLLPNDYQQIYDESMKDVPRYLKILRGVNVLVSDSGVFLGENVPAKYLLLFQNTNEVRPTGGFIGSYGIMTMLDGKMESLEFDDVYNPDGQLLEEITPPYPIWLMSDQWGMRDSNWSPDFPQAADQAVRMFEKGGGYSVDGVIAFTPKIIEKLLELTGPIEMEEYDVILTASNFVDEAQREIEIDRDADFDKPKQILADMLPKLMEELGELEENKKKDLWQAFLDLLSQKDVMVFMYDDEVEDVLKEVGWGGEIEQTKVDEDYLYMVHANIGGRKSDAFIKESVIHEVNIDENGSIIVDLEIVRKNIDDWTWPNYPNFDYLRVYVPEGSELLEVDGFVDSDGMHISDENVIDFDSSHGEAGLSNTKSYVEDGKQVFANWIVTDPYEATRVRYKYKLPFKLSSWSKDGYDLYLQHQPGRDNIDYRMIVDSGNFDIFSVNEGTIDQEGKLVISTDMNKDMELEIKFK